MPIHDWARIDPCYFHSFHLAWVVRLSQAMNEVLPPDHYAMVAEALPRVNRELEEMQQPGYKQRTVTVRHTSDDRTVALVEMLSPGTKDWVESLRQFVGKSVGAIRLGIHVVIVDLFPPGQHDPAGVSSLVWKEVHPTPTQQTREEKPVVLASFAVGDTTDLYIKSLSVGDSMEDMPLFLTGDEYVMLPLRSTYESAYDAMPTIVQNIIEGRRNAGSNEHLPPGAP